MRFGHVHFTINKAGKLEVHFDIWNPAKSKEDFAAHLKYEVK